MKARHAAFSSLLILLLLPARGASADEGIAGLRNVASEPSKTIAAVKKPSAPTKHAKKRGVTGKATSVPQASEQGQAVPSNKVSLVSAAPVLLPFFNNGPVFGIPGTVTGDFWNRTQVTGDWGGARTELARNGLFFDLYTTSVYQDVTSGGLKTGDSFVQNIQASFNLDTARAGLWSGGLFHFTAQSRYGSTPQDTFTVGSTAPQYTGLVLPGPTLSHDTLPSEYFYVQALSKQTFVVLGKISDVFIPDQTLLGDSYKYYFANFNFNKNPMTANFYNPTALAALAAWAPTQWLAFAGGVLDPNSQANNLATDAFNKVNLYAMAVISYSIGNLPGQVSPAFNWSNKPKIDLTNPFGTLTSLSQVTQAVGGLLGANSVNSLPANYRSDSYFAIANFSQYLFVKDTPPEVLAKMKSGQPLNGVGIFARVGYAPPETNLITQDYSIALVAHGLIDGRSYDSFGVGYYDNVISNNFKTDITNLTLGQSNASNEQGIEGFYNFAVTPAIRLIPSFQHIWNPLAAEVSKGNTQADVFLTHLTIAW